MDAWRTSCPRLPVWEEATERGLVSRRHMAGAGSLVSVSAAGTEYLSLQRGGTVALP
jgi:D-3-phosphoglycerate dehydrogenase